MLSPAKADKRTRTVNLLITNQLLCQLSHIGVIKLKISPCRIYISSRITVPSKLHIVCFLSFNQIQTSFPRPSSGFGQADDRLVAVSSIRYRTSTPALSTSSSSRGLGYLILRGASRLDAFSVYPVRTRLPGCALGSAAGTPAVRPSRSSRTKDSSSLISYARAG